MIIDEAAARKMMPLRTDNSHKGTYGTVLIIGGSRNMPGAPCIAALGALHSGAGLVRIAFPDVIYNAVSSNITEATFIPLSSNERGMFSVSTIKELENELRAARAVVIGCGMGVCFDTISLTEFVLENAECPVIVDADALNCVSKSPEMLRKSRSELILTPHPGEMSRLIKKDISFINDNREAVASSFASEYGVTVLLKGHGTVIADRNGDVRINTTGNSGLAKGGSGDLLSGIIGALAANIGPFDAASLGAYIHGLSGDIGSKKHSPFCLTPVTCCNYLSDAFNSLI